MPKEGRKTFPQRIVAQLAGPGKAAAEVDPRRLPAYPFTASSSTSKIRVEYGGMPFVPPAP